MGLNQFVKKIHEARRGKRRKKEIRLKKTWMGIIAELKKKDQKEIGCHCIEKKD